METRPGHEIAAAISAHAPGGRLEWAAVRTLHEVSVHVSYPYTGFRLAHSSPRLIEAIAEAVGSFRGREAWHIARDPSKRENYVIKPGFVDELAGELPTRSLRERTAYLAELVPDRCIAANADVPELARHLAVQLERLREDAR